jgi:hypothetical protein
MAKLEIELYDAETDSYKKYAEPFVKARKVYDAIKMQAELEKEDADELQSLDKMLDYVAELFTDKAVTKDAILDGVPSDKLLSTLNGLIDKVMGVKENGLKKVAQQAQK